RLSSADRRRGKGGGPVGQTPVGSRRRFTQKFTAEIGKLSAPGDVRNEHSLKNGYAVHLLFPDHGPHAIVSAYKLALNAGLLQRLRTVAKELMVLQEEGFGGTVRVVHRNCSRRVGGNGFALTAGLRQQFIETGDHHRRASDPIKIRAYLR